MYKWKSDFNIKIFKDKKSFICSKPLSVNLIGEREWTNLYDFVEIVRIPELLDYYRSQGMSFWRYIHCKNYALRNFFNFFTKILIGGDKAGRKYVNFKKHFFKKSCIPKCLVVNFLFYLQKVAYDIRY